MFTGIVRDIGWIAGVDGDAVAFGVLTSDTVEQADARAGGAHGNKGADAAHAAIEPAIAHIIAA